MIRICILTSSHCPNDPRIFSREARTLSDAGYDVIILSQMGKNTTEHGVKIVGYGLPPQKILSRTERVFGITKTRLLRDAFHLKADVYHLHEPDLIPFGLALESFTKAKRIYDVHENYPLAIRRKKWIPKVLRSIFAHTDRQLEYLAQHFFEGIIAASEDIVSRFANHPNCMVIHNFVSKSLVSDQSFEKRRFSKNSYSVICTGELSEDRCILELINAIAELNQEFCVNLKLIGRFESETFRRKVESTDGYQYVDFLGWLPSRQEVINELYKADVSFLCVKSNPNQAVAATRSNRLFESMATGLPVIVSDFPEWEKIIKSVGCGITVDPLSVSDIKSSLADLFADPDLRRRMSLKGIQAVQETYNWEAESQRLLSFYERVLSR